MAKDIKELLDFLSLNCEQVLPKGELLKKLESGKKLKIKLGADPTAPDLHLGHAIVLEKMRQFQDLGHEVIFLIGDFTAMIGDPTGRSKVRQPITKDKVIENAKTYFEQVGKILDTSKMTVRYNSEWLSKLSLEDFLKIAGKLTLARVIEREDFQKRLSEKVAIGMHELFYPIMQGYDSVELKADIELGGTDQTFNLLMGRFLQEQFGQEPQVIMTTPLLEGLDGKLKMSKSYGNYIGLTEDPKEAFGKLMSISDELMWRYYNLLLFKTDAQVKELKDAVASSKLHPMNLKKDMAFEVVKKYWSESEAKDARANFEALFQKKDFSQAKEVALPKGFENPVSIIKLIKELGAIGSNSEGRRLIEAGAVKIDGEKVVDFNEKINWKSDMIVRVGKHRIYKLV